jgi:hypothetical protein
MAKVAAEFAKKNGLSNRAAARALGEFAGLLVKHLKKGNQVRITGLGTLRPLTEGSSKKSWMGSYRVVTRWGDVIVGKDSIVSKKAAARDPANTIVERVKDLVGDREKAQAWFDYQPLPAFENKTPRQLVAEGQAKAVKLHLDTLEDGVYA